jgi:hypothetical protein
VLARCSALVHRRCGVGMPACVGYAGRVAMLVCLMCLCLCWHIKLAAFGHGDVGVLVTKKA